MIQANKSVQCLLEMKEISKSKNLFRWVKPKSPQVQCVNLAMSFLFLPLDDNPSIKRSLLQISASLGHYLGDCNIKALKAFYGGMGKFTHPPHPGQF